MSRILSEHKITSLKSLHTALQILHSPPHSVPQIALSSISLPLSLVTSLALPVAPDSYTRLLPSATGGRGADRTDAEEEVLVCFASSRTGEGRDGEGFETWAFGLPTIDGYYSGVGDLFSALVLGHFRTSEESSDERGAKDPVDKEATSLLLVNPDGSVKKFDPLRSATQEESETSQPRLPEFPQAISLALLSVQQILLKTHLHTLSVSPIRIKGEPRGAGQDDCLPSDPELDAVAPASLSGEEQGPGRVARRSRLRELRLIRERRLLMEVGSWRVGLWMLRQMLMRKRRQTLLLDL